MMKSINKNVELAEEEIRELTDFELTDEEIKEIKRIILSDLIEGFEVMTSRREIDFLLSFMVVQYGISEELENKIRYSTSAQKKLRELIAAIEI